MPLLEVSPGELCDRLSILELKLKHVPPERSGPVVAAKAHVEAALADVNISAVVTHLDDLRDVNERLWALEDAVRDSLSRATPQDTQRFVEAAAAVPVLNDRRARIKRDIDEALCYAAHEVKWYSAA